jgi:hypothetical protein
VTLHISSVHYFVCQMDTRMTPSLLSTTSRSHAFSFRDPLQGRIPRMCRTRAARSDLEIGVSLSRVQLLHNRSVFCTNFW